MWRTSREASRRHVGFTLIELLIVVAIIGILAAIAIPNFMNSRIRATTARARAEMRNVVLAMEQFRLDNGAYLNDGNDPLDGVGAGPAVPWHGGALPMQYTRGDITTFANVGIMVPLTTPLAYMSSVPTDPFWRGIKVDLNTYPGVRLGFPYVYDTVFEPINRSSKSGVIYFVLGAMGPDLKAGDVMRFNGPFGYDPSNGLRSRGDLIRLPIVVNAPGGSQRLELQMYKRQGAQ